MSIFTQQERFVILFLIFLLVLGGSVYLYKLNHPSAAPAYIIKDFEKKIHEEKQNKIQINYNLPSPPKEQIEKQEKKLTVKININSAGMNELQKIPGIGPVYAGRITEYRNKHNGFNSISEIKKIKGIGDKKFNKMKKFITTN
jgi:comEA protein